MTNSVRKRPALPDRAGYVFLYIFTIFIQFLKLFPACLIHIIMWLYKIKTNLFKQIHMLILSIRCPFFPCFRGMVSKTTLHTWYDYLAVLLLFGILGYFPFLKNTINSPVIKIFIHKSLSAILMISFSWSSQKQGY